MIGTNREIVEISDTLNMFKYEDNTLRSGWSMARNFCGDFLIKYYISIHLYTIEQISIFSLRFQMFVSWMSKKRATFTSELQRQARLLFLQQRWIQWPKGVTLTWSSNDQCKTCQAAWCLGTFLPNSECMWVLFRWLVEIRLKEREVYKMS